MPTIDAGLLPSTRPAQNALTSPDFTAPFQLVGDVQTSLSSRAALMFADGDFKTQALLRFLSKPEVEKFKDKVVLFGVSMVSVAPGNRTYRGFAGEVAVSVDFDFVTMRRELKDLPQYHNRKGSGPPPIGATPLVAAVSPMTETQTLDLKSSIREQWAIALRIALALEGLGAKAEAEAYLDYVTRLEQDVATRSAANYVTSFSQSGGIFGYHVAPRLTALSDPSVSEAKPDMMLERQTFPVLVILGIDKDELQIYQRVLPCGCMEDVEPVLRFRQTTRWIPLGNSTQDRKWFGRFFDQCFTKRRLTEVERMDWMKRIARAREKAEGTTLVQHACLRTGELRVVGAFEEDDRLETKCNTWKTDEPVPMTTLGPGLAACALASIFEGQVIAIRVKSKDGCWLPPKRDESGWELFGAVAAENGLELHPVSPGDWGEDAPLAFVLNRLSIFDYGGLDSWSFQSFPHTLYESPKPDPKPEPFKGPSISAVVPTEVISGRRSTVVLMGRNLKALPKEKLRKLGIETKQFAVEEVSNESILLTVETSSEASGILYFEGVYADAEGKETLLRTPPIQVVPVTRATKTMEISHFWKDGEERLVFPLDAPPDLVRKLLEPPPASQPSKTESCVDIDVNVENSGNKQEKK